jgi:sugar lactone lactonase YvrE
MDSKQPARIERLVTLNGRSYPARGAENAFAGKSKKLIRLSGTLADGVAVLNEPDPAVTSDPIVHVESESASPAATNSWTLGLKRICVIRVDFSDLPGEPVGRLDGQVYTAPYVKDFMDGTIGQFYRENSYGASSITNTFVTPVLRMPQTAAYYATNYAAYQLHADAQAAASSVVSLTDFDRILVLFSWLGDLPNSRWYGAAGLADVGGARVWINGELDIWTVAHEIGHTYGLFHANLWQVNDGNPISPAGASAEYGDVFDRMGSCANDLRGHFNPWYKNMLGWIPDGQIQTVTFSGNYRVNQFDTPTAHGTLALKIPGNGCDYWVSCRRAFSYPTLKFGAYIFRSYGKPAQSDLLDFTNPGTNAYDAGLGMGAAFTDPDSGVTIQPIANGGSGANQWLDVQITVPTNSVSYLDLKTFPSPFNAPVGLAIDTQQNLYVTENFAIRKISASASVTTLNAGSFQLPAGIATSPDGRIFVVDRGLNCVQTINASGIATLFAGQPNTFGSADGPALTARFMEANGIAIDQNGDAYVTDAGNHTIRKISNAGIVSTFAGQPGVSGSTDGIGAAALFNRPTGIAIDKSGNLFVTDSQNSTIRKISITSGAVTLFAGSPNRPGAADGLGTKARFDHPQNLAIDLAGNLLVSDTANHTVRKITPSGAVTTILGRAQFRGSDDGLASASRLYNPGGIAVSPSGAIYIADTGNNTIRVATPHDARSDVKLAIAQTNGQAVVNWPATFGAYKVQSSENAQSWTDNFAAPWVIDGASTLTNQPSARSTLFRLQKSN